MKEHYNLLDEQWIPFDNNKFLTLLEVFEKPEKGFLSGNSIEKIAVFKFLLAIGQSAFFPKDIEEWNHIGMEGFQRKVIKYLKEHKNDFFLYGDNPFLQYPILETKDPEMKSYDSFIPHLAEGNTSVLYQSQIGKSLTNAQKTIFLLVQGTFGFGSKKVDKKIILSDNFAIEKKKSAKSAPALGNFGYLHNFVLGETLLESIYCNLLSDEEITSIARFNGLGKAPWEAMPKTEDDTIADRLKDSYMGRLVPLARFVLLKEEGLYITEGIIHKTLKEDGVFDPSILVNMKDRKNLKATWADPQKKPWRYITGMLAHWGDDRDIKNFQIEYGFRKVKYLNRIKVISIWSAGLKVSGNAGEQYCSQNDDFVDSEISINTTIPYKKTYEKCKSAIQITENYSKLLYACIKSYYQEFKIDHSSAQKKASIRYWQISEKIFNAFLNSLNSNAQDEGLFVDFERKLNTLVRNLYESHCPHETSRQIENWVIHYPHKKIKS